MIRILLNGALLLLLAISLVDSICILQQINVFIVYIVDKVESHYWITWLKP